ncbi:MAG: alpha/beta fold hydrolase [Acidimicrobiia bacterium]|nr:alpha/beta fold hydrolase [Acidimicrobiia bacterium]
MPYAPLDGLDLYYEVHGTGRPLVLLHGGVMTIDLTFGALLEPLAASRQVIAVELEGHGHTALTDRATTVELLAGDVLALLDHLGVAEADVFGFSLGGMVACAMAIVAPARLGKVVIASADPHRPPGRESVPLPEDRMPTADDFARMRASYEAVAPDPARFEASAEKTSTMVHTMPGWNDELRSLTTPVLLIFGDRDFWPLADVLELVDLLPDAQLAVLPGALHVDVPQRTDALLAMVPAFLDAGR